MKSRDNSRILSSNAKSMKENKAKIKGNSNTVIQGSKGSKVTTGENTDKKKVDTYQVIGIIVTVLALVVSVIIGWDEIVNFFST